MEYCSSQQETEAATAGFAAGGSEPDGQQQKMLQNWQAVAEVELAAGQDSNWLQATADTYQNRLHPASRASRHSDQELETRMEEWVTAGGRELSEACFADPDSDCWKHRSGYCYGQQPC